MGGELLDPQLISKSQLDIRRVVYERKHRVASRRAYVIASIEPALACEILDGRCPSKTWTWFGVGLSISWQRANLHGTRCTSTSRCGITTSWTAVSITATQTCGAGYSRTGLPPGPST